MDSKRSPLAAALSTGLKAARQNRIPGIVMWFLAMTIIVGYYFFEPIHAVLESIGQFKQQWGWNFSLVSTAIFGGLIPAVVAAFLSNRTKKPNPSRQETTNRSFEYLAASTLLWAYKGVEIDCFYHFQAWLFGTATNFSTVLAKTICDQFVMVPIFGMVNVVLFYHWRDCGYSFAKAWQGLKKGWYSRLVLPALIANWFVWIPAVAMIYCLPTALQLPVQNLILCFWVLILLVFTGENSQHDEPSSS